ncbi:MAG TPA: class II aldolase/adducin family protein [Actinocrinis sp.]|nr:class II aldolase/adducin family protein [Actinocrinis sp.]
MLLAEEREALAAAGRRLAARGLVIGTSGNLSARRDDLVAVTPTGGVISELRAGDMTVIRLSDGEVADGDLAPTSEVPMHLAIYRATSTGAIAHTHATASTALGLVCDEIPLVHYAMLSLGGAVRVAPYACYGTEELAALVVKALEYKQAALLRNHGSIALGSSVAKSVDNLELVEWAAEAYTKAVALGAALHGPGAEGARPRELTQKEQEDVINAALASGYGTTRKLGG